MMIPLSCWSENMNPLRTSPVACLRFWSQGLHMTRRCHPGRSLRRCCSLSPSGLSNGMILYGNHLGRNRRFFGPGRCCGRVLLGALRILMGWTRTWSWNVLETAQSHRRIPLISLTPGISSSPSLPSPSTFVTSTSWVPPLPAPFPANRKSLP